MQELRPVVLCRSAAARRIRILTGCYPVKMGCRTATASRMMVNPEVLTWARKTAGFTADEAARALGFNDTRDRSAAERLMALENGRNSLRVVSWCGCRKHTGVRCLSFTFQNRRALVIEAKTFAPFRWGTALYNPLLDALIRDIRGRQTTVAVCLKRRTAAGEFHRFSVGE